MGSSFAKLLARDPATDAQSSRRTLLALGPQLRRRRKSIYGTNGIVKETMMVAPLSTVGCKSQAGIEIKGDSTEGTLKVNQDRGVVQYPFGPGFGLFGVFDGHGASGHAAAEFCITRLPTTLSNTLRTDNAGNALKQAFLTVDAEMAQADMDVSLSGATAVACLIRNQHVTIAHCGDSRVVVIRRAKPLGAVWTAAMSIRDAMKLTRSSKSSVSGRTSGTLFTSPSQPRNTSTQNRASFRLKARSLTQDHTPEHPAEKARLVAMGVQIHAADKTTAARVLFDGYGLAMTRSLGDHIGAAKAGVIPDPEVTEYDIEDEDYCLVIASDGVWEMCTGQDVADVVASVPDGDAQAIADAIEKRSSERWFMEEKGDYRDDTTVIVIRTPNWNDSASV